MSRIEITVVDANGKTHSLTPKQVYLIRDGLSNSRDESQDLIDLMRFLPPPCAEYGDGECGDEEEEDWEIWTEEHVRDYLGPHMVTGE